MHPTAPMSDDEWQLVCDLLDAGFAASEPIDGKAWRFLLRRFTYPQVRDAIEACLGDSPFRPVVSEVVGKIPARFHEYAMSEEACRLIEARKAHIEALEAAENARRDRELDEWTPSDASGRIA